MKRSADQEKILAQQNKENEVIELQKELITLAGTFPIQSQNVTAGTNSVGTVATGTYGQGIGGITTWEYTPATNLLTDLAYAPTNGTYTVTNGGINFYTLPLSRTAYYESPPVQIEPDGTRNVDRELAMKDYEIAMLKNRIQDLERQLTQQTLMELLGPIQEEPKVSRKFRRVN